MRINPSKKPQKEPTYQVFLDALTLSPYYPAFLITAEICPRLHNQEFDEPPYDEEIISFVKELGYKGDIRSVTKVFTDHMHQPWRTFAAIINKCLSRKTTCLDKIKLSRAQILWGMDDSILGTLKFVAISEDNQVYGALIPEVMINLKIQNSSSYKIYLAFATGKATPKKARKDTPGVSVSKKKAPTKAERNEGIVLLSEAALLMEVQMKKAIKRSKHENTYIRQVARVMELGVSDDDDDDDKQGDDKRTQSDDDKNMYL
ncbi:hypothetical protein Tco_1040805 [Tanacetum coccineum]|uniref:Uncharacterized protein n=1 Tax=Tanacetum coccineum TaxID=301880 RepID=A0ABQ5GF02_9ASTR